MKQYRVSLEVVTSPAVTDSQLADLLGVLRSGLVQERRTRSILWRYEPTTGQTGTLEDRIRQLASEVCPRRALPRGGGFRRVSLGIEAHYDTMTCTVVLPLYGLVYGRGSLAERLPELSRVELTCRPSDEDLARSEQGGEATHDRDRPDEEIWKRYEAWKAAGRPTGPKAASPLVLDSARRRRGGREGDRGRRTGANEYIVSLDAITSTSATASEVAEVLGLPPDAFYHQRRADDAVWTCEVEADQSAGLAELLTFLASEAHPRRSFDPDGEIRQIYLDIGVFYDVRKTETCHVRLPTSGLSSLIRKLFVLDIEVRCYPCDSEAE